MKKIQQDVTRCAWAATGPLDTLYHDHEWGVPEHDDRKLFEMLLLEGVQAGLSWTTVLKKRENYRKAFDGFDPTVIARYGAAKTRALLQDAGIIRNRLKVQAAVQNARCFLEVQEEFGSFDAYLWPFIGGEPRQNAWRRLSDIPAETSESKALSKALKKRGFRFAGPTICYAFMQAVGMVNDHVVGCFRYQEIKAGKKR
jgi:DNA-3-methyladenine glycosylase I